MVVHQEKLGLTVHATLTASIVFVSLRTGHVRKGARMVSIVHFASLLTIYANLPV